MSWRFWGLFKRGKHHKEHCCLEIDVAQAPATLRGCNRARYTRVKGLLGKLNKHYNKRKTMRVLKGFGNGAYVHVERTQIITFNSILALRPQILAHEYAHYLQGKWGTRRKVSLDICSDMGYWHDDNFFEKYKEVCQFLHLKPRLNTWGKCQKYITKIDNSIAR